MNKNHKIISSITIISVIIVAVVASIYFLGSAQLQAGTLPSGRPPQFELKIIGKSEETLTIDDLTQMQLKNVTTTIKGETANYIGVTLTDLLIETGASWDAGYIKISAADGFSKTISSYEAYNSSRYPGLEVILAFAKNSQWITDTSEGSLKLITPTFPSNYNIKSVAKIELAPWAINVTGAVNNQLTLTSEDFADIGEETIQATFAPSDGPQRISNWTGVSVWSILQASQISDTANKVTVKAVDGYSKEFTVTQVQESGMMIGYQENGVYLQPIDGQPYRLIVPTEEFKWGQNWVRWVSEIIVS